MTDDSSPDFLHDRYYSKGPTGTANKRGEGEKGGERIKVSPECERNSENLDGRTFGGMPLMTGIKRIYKKSAMVKRPENTERPTNGLVRREEERVIEVSHGRKKEN